MAPPPPPQLPGIAANGSLTGTAAADTMTGLDAHDTIPALGGHDAAFGGNGNDRINGGAGADRPRGGAGNDLFDGGAGRDTLTPPVSTANRPPNRPPPWRCIWPITSPIRPRPDLTQPDPSGLMGSVLFAGVGHV